MAKGRGEAAFPEGPGNETDGWTRCRPLRQGTPVLLPAGPPRRGERAAALGPSPQGFCFRKGPFRGTFPPARVPGARRAPGKRRGAGAMRRHLRSQTIPELQFFPTSASPSPLQPPSGERGFPPPLRPRSVARLSPFPGFTFLISFFLHDLFYALVRLDKSIPRFPLPAPFLGVSFLSWILITGDGEPRAAAGAAGLSPPVSRPPVGSPRRAQHLAENGLSIHTFPFPRLPALGGLAASRGMCKARTALFPCQNHGKLFPAKCAPIALAK